jgi:hypothetical protein
MSAHLRAQLWVWETTTADSDGGGARWMRGRTIELDRPLCLRPGGLWKVCWLAGDDNVIFVSTYSGVFMVHLESMQFEKVFETSPLSDCRTVHPLKNLYAPGNSMHLHCKCTKSTFPIIGLWNTIVLFNAGLTIGIQSYIHICSLASYTVLLFQCSLAELHILRVG